MENLPKLPSLQYKGKEKSKLSLHLFLQIIGKIRLKLTPRKNHWWYITEYIGTSGFTTGPIPYKIGMASFSITLNVIKHRLEIATSQGEIESFSIVPNMTVAKFYSQVMEILQKVHIEVSILDKPFDLGINKHFAEITEYHHYDKQYTKDLWQILLWVDAIFKEFSGRFYGKTCPVHLYWHSMDLAVTRFSGKEAPTMGANARISDKDAYTHECISFGFWAGDVNIPEPAFYSYTYPSPVGLGKEALKPSSAEWIDNNGSPMALLKHKNLLNSKSPKKELLEFLESAYRAGAKKANWDIEKFRVPDLNKI